MKEQKDMILSIKLHALIFSYLIDIRYIKK